MSFVDKDLQSMQEARILVETARDAHLLLREYGQIELTNIVSGLIEEMSHEHKELIHQAVLETGYGNERDENDLFEKVTTQIKQEWLTQNFIGVLKEESENKWLEVGVPLGVVGIALPAENIVLNALYATLICLKSGNTLVMIPPYNALEITKKVMKMISDVAERLGVPKGSINWLEHVSTEGIEEIHQHPDIAIILNIGCGSYIDQFPVKNKPVIYGGTASTPVFIEKSADIKKACQQIVASRSYDNGLLPGAEQYVISEGVIAKKVKESFTEYGAYFMNEQEESSLVQHLSLSKQRHISPYIGKSASWLAEKSGFHVPKGTKVLVSEQPYIFDENPYAADLRLPILTFYLEPDWLRACEKCIELLQSQHNGHTLAIHSHNTQVIQEFALKKPVGRMIVNGPASFTSLGLDSNLATTMILGGLTTGRGVTAKNVTPKELTYTRQIGYGTNKWIESSEVSTVSQLSTNSQEQFIQLLKKLLDQ
ncbi:aldehyde dehydrogenase family protein [Vagococcus humatus]|uniref:Aldehyde dehydrogenase domain-containing protein n=1 Tax=Vagococcus humatus TaxID=1889241 RepID=A0A429Z4Z0_9ENTE|nr:aldehyde dehydrogenase family protein [Vagococcus humatus]RST88758.1 hypothetical protein C7P63_09160 [Vagococcus humatus]